MSEAEAPRNRKERRAAARENKTVVAPPKLQPKIKMAQPDRSGPKAGSKTLYELAEERQDLIAQGQPFDIKHEDGVPRGESGEFVESASYRVGDDPLGPLGDSILFAFSLGMLHFTLDVLVYSQYRQEIEWSPIFVRTATILPILFMVIYTMKSKTATKWPNLRQTLFLVIAVAAGCYMIYVGNTYDYFAVMKRAPPVGTLWIWSVIEMKLPFALLSVVIDGGYLWWKGFSAF